MSFTLSMLLALQQLQVSPFPAEVGQPVQVRATAATGPVAGLQVSVQLPDGQLVAVGTTDPAGAVSFVPQQVGLHCYRAELDGVHLLAPHQVVPLRRRWLFALVCVPLGLALLWRALRPGPRGWPTGSGGPGGAAT